jgi:carbamoyl-phosphate synthase large subunit
MNILITSAGRRNYIVEYFQQTAGKDNVFVSNSIKNAAGVFSSSQYFISPQISSDEYIPFLLDICKSNNIGLILSLFDQDLLKLSKHKQEFAKNDITVAVSDLDVIDTTFDKLKFSKFLLGSELLSPKIYKNDYTILTKLKNHEMLFPIIIKPRWGTGSIATQVVNNENELMFFIDYLEQKIRNSYIDIISSSLNEILLQQFITGDEYHLDIINDLKGNYVTTFPKKKLAMRNGETDAAITLYDKQLIEIGMKLGKKLRHFGLLDVDLIKSEDGEYFIVDANPRFGGGYPFSHVAGANIPACIINWAKGENPKKEWLNIENGVIAVKGITILKSRN